MKKGISTLIDYSLKLNLNDLHRYLIRQLDTKPQGKICIHPECQREVSTKLRSFKRKIDSNTEDDAAKLQKISLRSFSLTFEWKEHCFLCGKVCIPDPKHPDRQEYKRATTLPFKDQMLRNCENRNDIWSSEVKHRLFNCIDLVQVEARYHKSCH